MRNLFIIIYFSSFCSGVLAQIPTYDGLGRVIRYTYPNDTVISYTFDAGGNRLTYKVQRSAPDLALQNATLNGVTAANLGEVIQLSVTVANIGARTTGLSSGLRVLLSTDCTASANDSLLYQTTIPVLAASATQPLTGLTLQLPTRIATGNYNILVVADTSNLIAELDETNNIACLPLQINRFYVSCRGTIPRNGLVAYYPFNGNANDESGNANHGTPSGVTATTDRYGNPNSAYRFNGINNFVQIPYNRSLLPNNDQKTYSFWFKFNTTALNDLLFQNGNADYSDGQFAIRISSQGVVYALLHSYWGYGGGTRADYMLHTIPNFDVNKRYFLAITVDNLAVKYYLDGVLIATRTWNLNYKPYDSSYQIEIGRAYNSASGGYAGYFKGELDDVAIHNRILTPSEISAMYGQPSIEVSVDTTILAGTNYIVNNHTYTDGGTYRDTMRTFEGCDSIVITNLRLRANPCAPIPTTGLVARYDFNGNANDLSGNNNHGTVNGATLTTDRFGRPNQAYSFNGNNDYIKVNSIGSDKFPLDFTFSCWASFSSFNLDYPMILGGENNFVTIHGLGPVYGANRKKITFYRELRTFPQGQPEETYSTNPLVENQHYHIVALKKGTNLLLYVDGVLQDMKINNNILVAGSFITFGKRTDIASSAFQGKIDDILIYNRALTHAEIVNLYGHQGLIEIRRDTTLCMGKSVQVGTHRYTQTGLYRDTLRNGGCDTIVITNLTITPPQSVRIDTSICANKTLIINAKTYRVAGTYQDTFRANGCIERVYDLTLRVTPLNTRTQTLTLCLGDSVRIGSRWVKLAGTYSDTLRNVTGGCDTVRTTLVQLVQPVTSTQFLDLCEGDSLRLHHLRWIYTGGTFRDTLRGQNYQGCDSMVISIVTLKPASRNTLRYTICQGNAVTVGGLRFDQAGVHTIKVPNDVGCDSILTLYLQVHPTRRDTIRAVLCQGSSYLFGNQTITQAGTYTLRLRTVFNCDSTVVLILRVNAPVNRQLDTSICAGNVLRIAHYQHRTTGIYRDTIRDINGCDSIRYVVNLTVHPLPVLTVITPTICEGSVFTQRNHIYRITGIYRDTFPNFRGCDSVVETRLTVYPSQRSTQVLELCVGDSIWLHNRRWVQLAGTSMDTLRNFLNCDSIVTTIIHFKPTSQTTQRISICQGGGVTVGDRRFTETGVYTIRFLNYVGCDSVVTLHLQVNPVKRDTIRHSICQGSSYLFGNQLLTQSGTYPLRLRTVFNCDSTVILILNVIPPVQRQLDTSICDGTVLRIGNYVHRVAGTYMDTLRNREGCDSMIVTVRLRLNALPALTVLQPKICEGDVWVQNQHFYRQTGIYRDTFRNFQGCDSIVETRLTVYPRRYTTQTLQICEGDSVFIHNRRWIKLAGNHFDTLRNFQNCDSIVTTVLQWKRPSASIQRFTICQGDTLRYLDTMLHQAGTSRIVIRNAVGCDSTITVSLNVNPVKRDTIRHSICQGGFYFFGNQRITQAGTYPLRLRTVFNCDSTVILILNVIPPVQRQLDTSICEGTVLRIGNYVHRVAGTYLDTLRTREGCDSMIVTVRLRLNALPALTVLQPKICEGEVWIQNQHFYRQTGIYRDTFRNAQGCDSVVETRLTVYPRRFTTQTVQLCEGDSIFIHNRRWIKFAGNHVDTLRNFQNCDSIVTIVLQLKRPSASVQRFTICQGDTLRYLDTMLHQASTFQRVIRNFVGCDSTITVSLNVNPVKRDTIRHSICQGGFYFFGNQRITQAGTYPLRLRTTANCDSTVILILNVIPPITRIIDTSFCAGGVLNVGNFQHRTTGNFTDTLRSQMGCDSVIVQVHLRVFEPSPLTQLRREICQGDSVRMGNQSYYTTGIHRKMLVNRNGCDSLVELNLTVNPLPQAQWIARPNFNVVTFENSSTNAQRYFWRFGDGDTSNLAQPTHTYRVGTYQVTLFASNNCGRDSLIIPITVRIPTVYASQNKTICYGKAFVINNHSYNTTGSYIDTTRSIWGGDTIMTTNLTVLPALARTIRVHICQGAFYQLRDGRRTDSAGTFLSVIPITGSCDSLITTIVTVQTVRRTTVDTTICNGSRLILPDNRPADTTGIYESRLRTVAGCDSFIITTRLTVLPFRTRTDSVAICEGYSYTSVANRTYRQAGTYWDTLRNRNCDTLRVKTVLFIKPTITRSIPATICQGMTYRLVDGRLTDSAGTYRSTLRGNGISCDTIVTTTLTVEQVIRRVDSAQICENGVYIFLDGRTTTRAGIYTTTLFTRLGCDSLVVKTYLRVYALQLPRKDTVTICYNSSHRLPDGRQVSTPGDYTSTIRSFVVNCDSIIVLTHLKVTQRATLPARPISTAGLGSNEIRFTFNDLDTNFRYTLHFGDSSQQMIRLGDTVWHHYRRDGDYQVQLIMEASCSRDTFQVNMPIFTPLRVRLAYPKVVCEGDSVRYQYIVQSGAVTNQFWNLQNGTPHFSLSPAPVVTYRTSGKWQVKLVVQNTLNSLELLDSIVVKPRARANFTYRTLDGFIAQFTQTATHATTYRWEFGDGSVSETPNAVHNYNGTGEFTVLLIVSNDCNRDTMRKVIQIGKTLTENLQSVNRFKLMPNPAQDELTIQLELKKAEKVTFRLLNLLGQEQLKRQPAMAKTFEQSFDVSGLSNGSYLLQIIGENGLMINEKVVIQH